jgi:hypothetical protein
MSLVEETRQQVHHIRMLDRLGAPSLLEQARSVMTTLTELVLRLRLLEPRFKRPGTTRRSRDPQPPLGADGSAGRAAMWGLKDDRRVMWSPPLVPQDPT